MPIGSPHRCQDCAAKDATIAELVKALRENAPEAAQRIAYPYPYASPGWWQFPDNLYDPASTTWTVTV